MDGDGHPLHLASCRVGSCRPEDGAAGGTQNPDLPDLLENRDIRGVGQPGQGDDQGGAQNQADDSGAAL